MEQIYNFKKPVLFNVMRESAGRGGVSTILKYGGNT